MFSIGQMSRQSGVKVPTIRYYEQIGLLPAPDRSAGNQRRYDQAALQQLRFIRHARQLGFHLDAIAALIELQSLPDPSCHDARRIARAQLSEVRGRIARLQALETELDRIAEGCHGDCGPGDCVVLASVADHASCVTAHDAPPDLGDSPRGAP